MGRNIQFGINPEWNLQNNQHAFRSLESYFENTLCIVWEYLSHIWDILWIYALLHSPPAKYHIVLIPTREVLRVSFQLTANRAYVSVSFPKTSPSFCTCVSVSEKVLRTFHWAILWSLLNPTLIFISSGDRSVLETVANVATSVPFVVIGLQTPRSAHSANCISSVKFSISSIIVLWLNSVSCVAQSACMT